MNSQKLSIRSISFLLGQEDEMLLYGQFLDDFYREKNQEEKNSLISKEPIYNEKYKEFLCLLAGSAEKLAKENNLIVPDWTRKERYILENVYYAYDTKNPDFQMFLFQTTPIEYKKRNLMVGNTILERC